MLNGLELSKLILPLGNEGQRLLGLSILASNRDDGEFIADEFRHQTLKLRKLITLGGHESFKGVILPQAARK
jgi:hypothetical protein